MKPRALSVYFSMFMRHLFPARAADPKRRRHAQVPHFDLAPRGGHAVPRLYGVAVLPRNGGQALLRCPIWCADRAPAWRELQWARCSLRLPGIQLQGESRYAATDMNPATGAPRYEHPGLP